MRREARGLLLAAAALCLASCATRPTANQPLERYSTDYGYRFENLEPGEDNSDSLFVVLTFSGGGTRAASFSYGVLEKLRDTEIVWEGQRRRLLDEVDAISSVSGGSLTGTYYAMFGDRVFEDFADKVLYTDIQGILKRRVLALRNYAKLASPFYSRTNLMAEGFDKDIFERKTFSDLLARNRRPFVVVNSTDISLGCRFEFTQDQFDLLYSDLGSFPLGHAVAASAAFPGLLTPMALRNHDNADDYVFPEWARDQLERPDPGRYGYVLAQRQQTYVRPGRPYVHLVDGGVSDNLGLLPVIFAVDGTIRSTTIGPGVHSGKVKKLLVITVNSKPTLKQEWDTRANVIGAFKVLWATSGTPLETFSQAQVEYLKLLLEKMSQERQFRAWLDGIASEQSLDIHLPESTEPQVDCEFVEVAFGRLKDEEEGRYLSQIPTTLQLPKEDVDRLRRAAATILDEHPQFQAFLDGLQAE